MNEVILLPTYHPGQENTSIFPSIILITFAIKWPLKGERGKDHFHTKYVFLYCFFKSIHKLTVNNDSIVKLIFFWFFLAPLLLVPIDRVFINIPILLLFLITLINLTRDSVIFISGNREKRRSHCPIVPPRHPPPLSDIKHGVGGCKTIIPSLYLPSTRGHTIYHILSFPLVKQIRSSHTLILILCGSKLHGIAFYSIVRSYIRSD